MECSRESLVKLVSRTAQSDEQAFAALYDELSPRVFGLALRILKSPAAAEEATLEAFTQLWNTAGKYDASRGDVVTWLLTITRTRALDLRRKALRRAAREDALEAGSGVVSPEPEPVLACADAEQAERVRQALACLPDEQRVCIETAYFGGLSYAEAAQELRQPLGTVKTRIRAGLATLRCVLGEVQAT